MKGKIGVELFNDQLRYEFFLDRKYSILTGLSGTGKTSLKEMVVNYYEDPTFRQITTLNCQGFDSIATVRVIDKDNFAKFLLETKNCLIILDETDIDNLKLGGYVKELNASDNYFLFITREKLGYLSYSYKSIYKIETDFTKGVPINRFDTLYKDVKLSNLKPEVILTEDSKSGYQFFDKTSNCAVQSAGSKTRIKSAIRKEIVKGIYSNIYVIADGAAIGSDIRTIVRYLESDKFLKGNVEVNIFLPESFEYLLLKTKVFDIPNLEDMLKRTYNYCDARKYISWERFYTSIIEKVGYTKSKLSDKFLIEEVVSKVYAQIEDLDKSVMDLSRLGK